MGGLVHRSQLAVYAYCRFGSCTREVAGRLSALVFIDTGGLRAGLGKVIWENTVHVGCPVG